MKLDKEDFAESNRPLRAPVPTEKRDGKNAAEKVRLVMESAVRNLGNSTNKTGR